MDGCGLRMVLEDLRVLGAQTNTLQEVVILSTCNRLEVYATAADPQSGWDAIAQHLANIHGVPPAELHPHLYFRQARATVEHLMRVASGLDSMILGEPQILGQVSNAIAEARVAGTSGALLSHLFNQAIHCGKRARSETEIGSYTTSLSHAAAQLAVNTFGDLQGRKALVIGAGEMAELAALAFQQHGAATITCINRTQARAERLAVTVDGLALGWARLGEALIETDVVISATSAPHTVIAQSDVAEAMAKRNGRTLMLLDIALPRDIDVAVDELVGVTRYDIDHLRDTVDGNLAKRVAAVPQVEEIVAGETDCFTEWLHGRQVVPALVELRRRAEDMACAELERTLRRLENLSGSDDRVEEEVAYLAHRIVHKLLHEPTVRLKAQAANGNGAAYAHMLEDLFALELPRVEVGLNRQNGQVGQNRQNGTHHHVH